MIMRAGSRTQRNVTASTTAMLGSMAATAGKGETETRSPHALQGTLRAQPRASFFNEDMAGCPQWGQVVADMCDNFVCRQGVSTGRPRWVSTLSICAAELGGILTSIVS